MRIVIELIGGVTLTALFLYGCIAVWGLVGLTIEALKANKKKEKENKNGNPSD